MKQSSRNLINVLIYVLMIIFAVWWVETNDLQRWIVILAALPPIGADLLSEYNPKLTAYIFAHKRRVVFGVLFICMVLSYVLFTVYNEQKHSLFSVGNIKSVIPFLLEGGLVGLILRMLLLNLFSEMLMAKPILKSKILILAAWIILLVLFPVNPKHRILASVFTLGFGLGFLFHYLIRVRERKNVQRNRLKENLLSMIAEIKLEDSEFTDGESDDNDIKRVSLTSSEEEAVRFYSGQKWRKLKKCLRTHKETTTMFFIRLCMLRKLHEYENALGLLYDRMDRPNFHQKNYYHLHTALNQSEIFDHRGKWQNEDKIFEHLEKAYRLNNDCLLTCSTYALRVAGEIDTNKPPEEIQVFREKALRLIWHAMKLHEGRPMKKIVGLATGMTIPVTYTFLLDTYGYVLLKCGRTRFSKALLLQCFAQDPTFSATYLHLGEWYFYYYGNNKKEKKNDTWKKSAKLNLHIAIEMEKENDRERKGTLISTKARLLLDKI